MQIKASRFAPEMPFPFPEAMPVNRVLWILPDISLAALGCRRFLYYCEYVYP